MRVIVVGLGVQGCKRADVAGEDCVASVDPVQPDAVFRSIDQVPLSDFDAALCCVPDGPRVELVDYLLSNGKHVLVEKPLWAPEDETLRRLDLLARDRGVICYTAYNHRFEPHFVRMRRLVEDGTLGQLYRCRLFYGNGTARQVRESDWRDTGSGVLHDLGSHLLDTAAYWFDSPGTDFQLISSDRFENRAPDHVVFGSQSAAPRLEFEMTLLSWRNHFTCDLFGEHGSAHIESLCKWGPSAFRVRHRVLPSGRPPEETVTLVQDDPTWALEYRHFKALCAGEGQTDLSKDIWLNTVLREIGEQTIARANA